MSDGGPKNRQTAKVAHIIMYTTLEYLVSMEIQLTLHIIK
jgi:hypothetical protein